MNIARPAAAAPKPYATCLPAAAPVNADVAALAVDDVFVDVALAVADVPPNVQAELE